MPTNYTIAFAQSCYLWVWDTNKARAIKRKELGENLISHTKQKIKIKSEAYIPVMSPDLDVMSTSTPILNCVNIKLILETLQKIQSPGGRKFISK